MNLHVFPSKELSGTLRIPGSKSQSVRALLVATLAKGTSILHSLPESEDVSAALEVCRDLGVQIETVSCHENCIRIKSQGVPLRPLKNVLWTANSGITTCFVLPILALTEGARAMQINADEQMKKRPIQNLLNNLSDLGVHVEFSTWPITVRGPLKGGASKVNGLTSQFISALLLSGIYAEQDVDLQVENLNERPYLELTLDWLRSQNIRFGHVREGRADRFHLPAGQQFSPIDYSIPGDYSSASTFLAAGALFEGDVRLEGLDPNSHQGDRRLLTILQTMGACVEISNGIIRVHKAPLKGIAINANDIPDLVPTLAVLGTQAKGVTHILNVSHARIKETDRLHSMAVGLRTMGADIEELEGGLVIRSSQLHGARVHGFNDHRTIMALALAGLLADGETIIDTAEGLNKTYPRFGDHLKTLNATLHFN
ncbi:MAG: 3-phosphoshikimate 1-carboxyvinyltransferase [Candidatus Gracilibacteria bacterium]